MGIRGLDGARWDLYPRGSFWRSAPTEATGRRDRANGKNGEMTPWRARPPKRSLEWAAASLGPGSRVISARLLDQGGWHANHAVTVVDARHVSHRLVLRRWARPGWALGDPDFTAAREVEVLKLLERNRIPAPRLVAADPSALACDVPALLTTLLPGHPPIRFADVESFLRQLAEMLARIHDVASDSAAVPTYRTYVDMKRASVPTWLRDSRTWRRALAVVRRPRQPAATMFIHRDYHPENSLWSRGRLTGIVDWTQASIGAPEVDVGHMRWNLVATYGQAPAERFLDLYESVVGRRLSDQPFWDLVTVLDLVLDVADPIPAVELERLETHAAASLAKLI